ncbi:hypothetical protein [Paenochrobactrum pullorum]|uniref:hypothetical protein n=1 Tax=Paenochrobactrum pullorum TaxID=1324351 RepID=UPI0035BC0B22
MQYTSRLSVRIFTFFIFLTLTLILAGCSQTSQPKSCTAAQKNKLIKEYNLLSYQIIKKRSELITAHENILNSNCRRSPFSTRGKSKFCDWQVAKIAALQSDMQTLQNQAEIYHAVINGNSITHPSLRDDGCTIRDSHRYKQKINASRKTDKTSARAKAAKYSKLNNAENSVKELSGKLERHPLEDEEYKVYTPPASVKITHEIVPETLDKKDSELKNEPVKALSFSPVSQELKNVAAGAERPYQPDPKIRVVGSKFFPDQEAVTSQPVPDQTP